MKNKKTITAGRFLFAMLLVCMMSLMPVTARAAAEKLNISQIVQKGEDVYIYTGAVDTKGVPGTAAFDEDKFEVKANSESAGQVLDALKTSEADEETTLVFCVDTSSAVADTDLQAVKEAVGSFIDNMNDKDRAGIITFAGEASVACALTDDREQLKSAVDGLAAEQKRAKIYVGLSGAMNILKDADAERAAVIMFTAGGGDNSEEQEARTLNARIRVPIYAADLISNGVGDEISTLTQIARQSGGCMFSGADLTVKEKAEIIRTAIYDTYRLHLDPEEDLYSVANIIWEVSGTAAGKKYPSQKYVFSLGSKTAVSSLGESLTEGDDADGTAGEEEETENVLPEVKDSGIDLGQIVSIIKENMFIFLAVLLVLAGLLIILIVLLRQKKKLARIEDMGYPGPGDENQPSFVNSTPPASSATPAAPPTPSSVPPAAPMHAGLEGEETIEGFDEDLQDGKNENSPAAGTSEMNILVQMFITFGQHSRKEEKMIYDSLVLGRGELCDVDVVFGEKDENAKQTSRRHASLILRQNGLFVKDEGARNKTFLNGREVTGEMLLKNDDVLQLGQATVRVRMIAV